MVKTTVMGGLLGGLVAMGLLTGCYSNTSGRVDDHEPVATSVDNPMIGRPTLGMPISVPGQSTVIVPFSLESRKGLFDDRDPYTKGGYGEGLRYSNSALDSSAASPRYTWNMQTPTRWHNAIVRDVRTGQEWMILESRGVISRYSALLEGSEGRMGVCRAMLFIATVDDTNGDGQLNDLDATVAILTDADGRNPRVVSPARSQVWQSRFDDQSQSVYLLVVGDTNRDGRFDTKDEPVPYVLPIGGSGVAQPVVSEATLRKAEGFLK